MADRKKKKATQKEKEEEVVEEVIDVNADEIVTFTLTIEASMLESSMVSFYRFHAYALFTKHRFRLPRKDSLFMMIPISA